MKLSVLINNYNYARFLGAAIDSALSQDFEDFEVVVVDDGSTDGSRAIIASYGDRIVPVLKENGGQASSFNAGFAAATGDVIFLLDADDTFLPGKLSRVAALYAGREIDWCFDRVTTDENLPPPDGDLALTPVDKRAELARGGFPSLPVPTSGLSFRRALLADNAILPMPMARDVVLSDNYLKFAAAYCGKGVVVDTPLTFQRIHGENRYTTGDKARRDRLRARIMVETGLELARRFPGLRKMGERLIAGGLALNSGSASDTWREIRRCTCEGIFGPLAAARITALVLVKKLLGRTGG